MKGNSFGKVWASMLWRAMSATGKGYRRPTLKNGRDGNGGQRGDKSGPDENGVIGQYHNWPKSLRSYHKRYSEA